MLEFVKYCNQTTVYERAKDCEITLKAFNSISSMATFIETLFKLFYIEFYSNENDYTVQSINFIDLLDDKEFTEQLKNKYGVTNSDIQIIDTKIRKPRNSLSHSTRPKKVSPQDVKECFHCVFNVAAHYYNVKTCKPMPVWDDNEYKELLDSVVSGEERKEREAEAKERISKLASETSAAKEEAKAARAALEGVTQELDRLRRTSVPVEVYEEYRRENARILEELDNKSSEMVLVEQREQALCEERDKAKHELARLKESAAADTDETKAQIAALENKFRTASSELALYQKKNANLENEISRIENERNQLVTKLEEQSKDSNNSALIIQLEERVKDAEAAKKIAEERLKINQRELEKAKAQLFSADDPISEINIRFQSNNSAILQSTPNCPRCNSKLVPSPSKKQDGGYYWRCPSWRADGSGCKGFIRDATEEEIPVAELILGSKNKTLRYVLPPAVLEEHKPDLITYENYEQYFSYIAPNEFYYQSIAVPSEMFPKRKQLGLDYFSRFRLISLLDKHTVDPSKRLIYSLVLRLLNRGIVLKANSRTEKAIKQRFNQKNIGATTSLFDYAEYSHPNNPYSSQLEKEFAECYLNALLGPSWGSYVIAQAPITLLTGEENSPFREQKVDFAIVLGNNQKVVIELDGPEHKFSEQYDSQRDSYLERNGFRVLRFKNETIKAKDPSVLSEIKAAIGQIAGAYQIDYDDRYTVACKLSHQIAIAIVKGLEQGYIPAKTNLNVELSSTMFTESEVSFIATTAIAEVYDLIQNFCTIYDEKIELDFLDELSPPVTIYIGDGPANSEKGIIIRDVFLPINFLCELEEFVWSGSSLKPDYTSMRYFLQYIFGYEDFQHEKTHLDGSTGGQFAGVSRLLRKKDSIILLPTGAGKSLIFQLSSYIVPGMIFVISPLVSLMEDQVMNLNFKFGINGALYFAAATTQDDKLKRAQNQKLMQRNTTSLIYCAPERLQIPDFRTSISSLISRNNVFAVAIDEAHCVSEWGHDFRPSYLNIGNSSRRLFKKNGTTPVLVALTGTASDAVLNDVRKDLQISGSDALVQPMTFNRPELHFNVISCPTASKPQRAISIIRNEIPNRLGLTYEDFVKRETDKTNSGIVFTPYGRGKSQYSAYSMASHISESLPELGTACYFSAIPQDFDEATWKTVIRENARRFKIDELNLLVATKAFGMGIDKPNIRFILHSGLPTSFEEYYQEAGRAGRDRKDSQCFLLFSNDDDIVNEKLLGANLTRDEFQKLYEESDQLGKFNNDDLSALLIFHTGTFKGVDVECSQIDDILQHFEDTELYPGKQISVFIPIYIEATSNGETVKIPRETTVTAWMRSLVRLVVLGVVQDYSYDYRGNFSLVVGSVDHDSVRAAFEKYILSSNKDVVTSNLEKIDKIESDGLAYVKDAARVLVEYIYETIEQSRRAAIRGMYYMAKDAAQKPENEKDQFIRDTIVSYFTYSGENRDELTLISEAEDAGLVEAVKIFGLTPDKFSFSEDEIEKAKTTYILAGRMLESKPDHPGLLLSQAIAKIIATDTVDTSIASNIIASARYSKLRYSVDDLALQPTISSALNLVLQKDYSSFESIVDEICEDEVFTRAEFIENLLVSNQISDSHRDYILLSYAATLSNKTGGKL